MCESGQATFNCRERALNLSEIFGAALGQREFGWKWTFKMRKCRVKYKVPSLYGYCGALLMCTIMRDCS